MKVFKEKKKAKEAKKLYKKLKKSLIKKIQELETIQTNKGQNRRFFQIIQIRTKHEEITQIHT